jgi:hypothetical protein
LCAALGLLFALAGVTLARSADPAVAVTPSTIAAMLAFAAWWQLFPPRPAARSGLPVRPPEPSVRCLEAQVWDPIAAARRAADVEAYS